MDDERIDVWSADDIEDRIDAGLALVAADDRTEPACTSDRYYEAFEAVMQLAVAGGRFKVIEAIGTLPPQYSVGDYSEVNRALRELLKKRFDKARATLVQTTATEPRYNPGSCPKCGARLRVASTREVVRHIKCQKCGYTGLRPV